MYTKPNRMVTMSRAALAGKVAIVTGASSGIGQATALALARQGADVALAARRVEALEEVAAQVRALGRRALVAPTDVTDASQCVRLVERCLAEFGRLDMVIANAGQYVRCPVAELSAECLEESLAVNFFGAVHVALAALPHLRAQRSGQIALVSSMDARTPLPLDAPYVAAKAALSGLGAVMRQELSSEGIHVMTVMPGRVDTPLIGDLSVPAISAKIAPARVADAILRGLRRRQAEVILPANAYLLMAINLLAPRVADWFIRKLRLAGWHQP
jgi:short-subunit dehydrogenase